MSEKRRAEIIAAGLKAGRDGFAGKQQLASIGNILATHKVDKVIASSILEEVKDSGVLNASATLQWLKKAGVIESKVDEALKASILGQLT